MMRKFLNLYGNPRMALLVALSKLGFYLPDRIYLEWLYFLSMGKKLDLDNPRTFCEKIQWLKIYNRKKEHTQLVNKLVVKEFVSNLLGKGYVIPTIAVFECLEDVDFDILPAQFVLKTTHGGGSGGVVICSDKENFRKDKALKKLQASLCSDIYINYREWPYKNIPRRIIAEPYLSDGRGSDLIDYKFFCFHGRAKYCQVIADRTMDETIDFYDRDWNHQEFIGLLPTPFIGLRPTAFHALKLQEKPFKYDMMLQIADLLAANIQSPFVRIDLYNIKGEIYFGEVTFFPASGIGHFIPEEWNLRLGNMIDLSKC